MDLWCTLFVRGPYSIDVLWTYGARCLSVGHIASRCYGLMVHAVCLWAI